MVKVIHMVVLFTAYHISGTLSFDDDRIFRNPVPVGAEFPYQVSIRWSDHYSHFCGGSIIGRCHILTAARCLKNDRGGNVPTKLISVIAGQNVLTINQNTVFRNVSRIYVHEEFDSSTLANNIAIIEVSEAFSLGDYIDIADIRRDKIKPGSKCTLTGWAVGKYGSEELHETLQATETEVIDFNQCQKVLAEVDVLLLPGMMCARNPIESKDATKGDSGGPLFCNGSLTGIVSTGKKSNDTKYPGVYTDIADYIPWITEKIESNIY